MSFLWYSGWSTWFCYLTPSWPGFHAPHPLPTLPPAQLVSGCGAEERLLHNPAQQERARIWQQGPQRSNPAAVNGISWYVPTLSLTKSQVILEKLQDHLLICTDILNASSPACSRKRESVTVRTSLSATVFWDPGQGANPTPTLS